MYGLSKEQVLQLLATKTCSVPKNEQGYDYPTIAGRIEETDPKILKEALIEWLYN